MNSSRRPDFFSVDIGVGGRFHADHMAAGFQKAHCDVHLFTTFPRSRFPRLPKERVHPFLIPELVHRGLTSFGQANRGDLFKSQAFGKAMARQIAKMRAEANLFIGWSSFSLETLKLNHARKRILVRDSAHIEFQMEVLRPEYERLKLSFPDRSRCVARELEEYELADVILTPSEFAKRTFVLRGVPAEKIRVLPLGVDTKLFQKTKRYRRKGLLRVVYFGALYPRKGVHHLLEATRGFSSKRLAVSVVGNLEGEYGAFLKRYTHVTFHKAMPHAALAQFLEDQDVFVLPSLEDGFSLAAIQSMAMGIVPIVTENCGVAEGIRSDAAGIVVPVGEPRSIRENLELLLTNSKLRESLSQAAKRCASRKTWEVYEQRLLATFIDFGP